MSIYRLERKQIIKAPLQDVWDLFSRAGNLMDITPTYMNFVITSPPHQGDVYPGQVITYKVSPLMGIPLSWMTEITHVQQLRMFVDEQRHGPYKLWHHQHLFEETPDGVLMTDIVHYQLPLWMLGKIAHVLFVKKQLNTIFDFRKEAVNKRFSPHQ